MINNNSLSHRLGFQIKKIVLTPATPALNLFAQDGASSPISPKQLQSMISGTRFFSPDQTPTTKATHSPFFSHSPGVSEPITPSPLTNKAKNQFPFPLNSLVQSDRQSKPFKKYNQSEVFYEPTLSSNREQENENTIDVKRKKMRSTSLDPSNIKEDGALIANNTSCLGSPKGWKLRPLKTIQIQSPKNSSPEPKAFFFNSPSAKTRIQKPSLTQVIPSKPSQNISYKTIERKNGIESLFQKELYTPTQVRNSQRSFSQITSLGDNFESLRKLDKIFDEVIEQKYSRRGTQRLNETKLIGSPSSTRLKEDQYASFRSARTIKLESIDVGENNQEKQAKKENKGLAKGTEYTLQDKQEFLSLQSPKKRTKGSSIDMSNIYFFENLKQNMNHVPKMPTERQSFYKNYQKKKFTKEDQKDIKKFKEQCRQVMH